MQVTSIPQSFVTFSPIEPAEYAAPHTFWLRMKSSRLPGLSREHTIAIEQAFRGRTCVQVDRFAFESTARELKISNNLGRRRRVTHAGPAQPAT